MKAVVLLFSLILAVVAAKPLLAAESVGVRMIAVASPARGTNPASFVQREAKSHAWYSR